MNQEIKKIVVELKKCNDSDILEFCIEDKKYPINLNNEDSQNDLKNVFCVLLENMIESTIELKLEINKNYKSGLFIDVCTEYIKELNREIKQVKDKIPHKVNSAVEDDTLENVE